jgi:hypothetical protein
MLFPLPLIPAAAFGVPQRDLVHVRKVVKAAPMHGHGYRSLSDP